MQEKVRLEIIKTRETAVVPFYANPGDAGMDICAAEDVTLEAESTTAVPTGLILCIPEGYEVQIRPRSGLSLKTRLRLPNSPGTIDSGYRDELKILMYNASPKTSADGDYDLSVKGSPSGTYHIAKGDRIAQMILAPVSQADLVEVKEFSASSVANRGGGFGSSGLRVNSEEKEEL